MDPGDSRASQSKSGFGPIETFKVNVLSEHLKTGNIVDGVVKELAWLKAQLR
jgi:hypothetical protein